MAYSDQRGLSRFNAVSIGGAFLINGVMLAGFALLGVDIVPKKIWTIMDTFEVKPDPPVEIEPRPRDEARDESLVTVPRTLTETPRKDETDFIAKDTDPISLGHGPGPIVDPTPIKLEPIFKSARFNPRYNDVLQPTYPPGMIRNSIEGAVTVKVLIGPDGRVKDVQAIRVDEQEFLVATRKQALGKWRFLPATRDGVAIESWREMTVRFILPKDR